MARVKTRSRWLGLGPGLGPGLGVGGHDYS